MSIFLSAVAGTTSDLSTSFVIFVAGAVLGVGLLLATDFWLERRRRR